MPADILQGYCWVFFSFLVKDNYCLIEQRTWAGCHDTVANFLKQLDIKIDGVKTFYLRWMEY